MKKLTLLCGASLIALCAHSQVVIPRAGVNLAKMSGDNTDDIKTKLGVVIGVAYQIEISDVFSIQPELDFTQKGFRLDASEGTPDFNYKTKGKISISYLDIPVMAKYAAPVNDQMKIIFQGGPALGIGLGGKYDVDVTVSYLGQTEKESLNADLKFGDSDDSDDETVYADNRVEFGFQVGAGLLIADKFLIDLRYAHGLTSLFDDKDSELYNRGFQISVGMPLRLK